MLPQKLRPQTFEEVLGNAAAVELLRVQLSKPESERPHVFGLVGPSGCGKTTLARIAANLLGGDELSIREINASDTRGIDTAREIADQMKFTTMSGAPQVWIIDECHKLTSDAWNCLLKPLEDVPKHVYVFLCTTEAMKIPAAVKTRTKIVQVEKQNESDLRKWLIKLAHKNEIAVSRDLLELIAENSDGSPRQALQFLESVIGVQDPETARKIIKSGAVEETVAKNLANLLTKRSPWKEIAATIKTMKPDEAESARRGVMGYCNAVLLNGSTDEQYATVLEIFASSTTYDSGLPGLTILAFQAWRALQN